MIGIAADRALAPAGPLWTALLAVGAATAALAVSVGPARMASAGLLTAVLAAGGLRHNVYWNHYPENHPAAVLGVDGAVADLEGVVRLPPAVRPPDTGPFASPAHRGGRVTFVLAAERLLRADGDIAVEGDVLISMADPAGRGAHFAAGDRLRTAARFFAPSPPDNPGEPDRRDLLRRRRILLTGFCDSPAAVRPVEVGVDAPAAAIAAIRRAVREPLARADLQREQKAFLAALLLGDRHGIDDDLMDDFALTGTTYFIVVSGQNVGLVVLFVYGLARAGLGRRAATIPAFAALALYTAVVDPQPPIVRAAVMAATMLAAVAVGRRPAFLNSLALAAALVLWINPADLFDAGFALSSLCTLALVELGPRIHAALFGRAAEAEPPDPLPAPPSLPLRALRAVGMWLSLNLAAWLFSVPLTMFLFHTLSLANPVVSLAANPFACLAMVIGFFGVAIGAVLAPVGQVLLTFAAVFGDVFVAWVRAAAGWKAFHLHVVGLTMTTAVLAYVLLFAWLLRRRLELGRSRIAVGVAVLAAFHAWSVRRPADPPPALHVAVLSVGHGSCVVGDEPGGAAWICDAGTLRASDLARATLRPYLDHRRLTAVDWLLLSHPDLDHFSGVPTLLRRTPVAAVVANPYFEALSADRRPARALSAALVRHRRPLRPLSRGDVIELDAHTTARVLWPPAGLSEPSTRPNTNDSSLVVRVEHGGYSILLTGDIGPSVQAGLLHDPQLRADVLLLPHHGSTAGNPEAFAAAVDPAVVIISNDSRRSLRFDRMATALRARAAVLHTAEVGAVQIDIADGRLRAAGFLGGPTVELTRPRSRSD
jgi:competence protein ComEC